MKTNSEYAEFLKKKVLEIDPSGFEVALDDINPMLFDWQRVCVRWALYKGKAALFEACGLGKTPQQLEWARHVCLHTGGNVLILAPLAVSGQTVREGAKFGINVNKCRTQDDITPGINITNYEMIDRFDVETFQGIVLDESSILKAYTGKTKQHIIESFRNTPFKLACTATPSPNDHMELLNHGAFLDIMPAPEALSRWFINDTMNFGTYRLKGHAVKDFWRWVSTWAVAINLPSDIGHPDDGFVLPALETIRHITEYDVPFDIDKGLLFRETEVLSATNIYRELRETTEQRTDLAAELVNSSDEIWVVWCNTNFEADALKKKMPDAIEVRGNMTPKIKESLLERFSSGNARVIIGKPSMLGFGLNWQHCHNMVSVGLTYSFEQLYQAVRRCWRYGQKERVNHHIVLSPAENQIFDRVRQKERKHTEMTENMVAEFRTYQDMSNKKRNLKLEYDRKEHKGKDWRIIIGDSCEEIKTLKDESIHFSIFSPPFSNLYIYSDHIQDMGNSKNDSEFFEHFDFLIKELYRITVQGRLCAVHCKDLVDYKNRDGMSGLRDFPGEIIRRFEATGWKFHSRVTIWKDPVIEMQRTKAQGLLHAQIKRDSTMSRQGLPDYLIVFRRWPENSETSGPEPVARPKGFMHFIGRNAPEDTVYKMEIDEATGHYRLTDIAPGDDIFSIHVWQRYASPVWFDVQQTNVLNCRVARDSEDEKHICPLQLDVIERAIHLWTNPGDTVFTPFAGICSELFGALKLGRKAIGIELKEVYADCGRKYLSDFESAHKQLEIFT